MGSQDAAGQHPSVSFDGLTLPKLFKIGIQWVVKKNDIGNYVLLFLA